MEWLTWFHQYYPLLFYGAFFIAMFIEGDLTLLFTGALISREKDIHFYEVFIVAFVATLIHDVLFWKIGNHLGQLQKKRYLGFNLEKISATMKRMERFAGIFIVFSKFAWNFNRVILVSIGYIKISLQRLMRYSLIAAIAWPLLYLSIGYVFADQTQLFRHGLERVGIFIAGVIVLIILFQLYIKKIITKVFYSFNGTSASNDQQK